MLVWKMEAPLQKSVVSGAVPVSPGAGDAVAAADAAAARAPAAGAVVVVLVAETV